jgi:hypothetical protein
MPGQLASIIFKVLYRDDVIDAFTSLAVRFRKKKLLFSGTQNVYKYSSGCWKQLYGGNYINSFYSRIDIPVNSID